MKITLAPGTLHLSGIQHFVSQTRKVRPGVAANNLPPSADHLSRLTPPPLTLFTGKHCSLATLQISMFESDGEAEANKRPELCQANEVTGEWPGWLKARTQLVLGRDTTLAGSRVHSMMPILHPTASSAVPQGLQVRHDIPLCPTKKNLKTNLSWSTLKKFFF